MSAPSSLGAMLDRPSPLAQRVLLLDAFAALQSPAVFQPGDLVEALPDRPLHGCEAEFGGSALMFWRYVDCWSYVDSARSYVVAALQTLATRCAGRDSSLKFDCWIAIASDVGIGDIVLADSRSLRRLDGAALAELNRFLASTRPPAESAAAGAAP